MPTETFFNLPEGKRRAILDIAIEEFAENEYNSASISHIVAQAGIAKGSFYQYFENKEDLYRYLLTLGSQQKAKFLSPEISDPSINIFAYLGRLIEAGVRYELSSPKLSKIGYRAVRNNSLPEDIKAQSADSGRGLIEQLVASGKRRGDIRPDVDEDLAAFVFQVIFSELGGYIMQRLQVGESLPLADGRSLFEAPEAQAIFIQILHILEFGMGKRNG